MIVPMKKVSLIILGDKKKETLKKLRRLGILHIEISEGSGEKLISLKENIALIESALYTVGKSKNAEEKDASAEEILSFAKEIDRLSDKKKEYQSEKISLSAELDRLKGWGEIDPDSIRELDGKGTHLSLYEMPKKEYRALGDDIKTLCVEKSKASVKFLVVELENDDKEARDTLNSYRVDLPETSTSKIEQRIADLDEKIKRTEEKISSHSVYIGSMKKAIKAFEKEVEFETLNTGMDEENLSGNAEKSLSVAYFKGYIEAEKLDRLKEAAMENSWGLIADDPTEDDNVPTKLQNNKFVSLIYPLTDFLGTVPGYFEYDISAWFLSFILIFFGIIFGDGGYGLLISGVAAIPIIKNLISKKSVSPAFLLILLFGLSTILWGTLTCTWFGLSPSALPVWLKNLSIPVISNVYADKIWYPFWSTENGLTTAQNLQIFCFSLALIQLSVAHVKGAVRNRKSLKMLGDIGAILQLVGIFYVVLSLVVNAKVFSFSLILFGIPIGTVAICLIGIGFVLSFVFSNYEGSVIKSILTSLVNIVSVLLGVVNVFSDIVSYIRLWAVGLAGAAISATVNELAGPLLSNFMLMILAIVLLVFGHGLNMILNILSVIVHGIRLNTLEFSSHLDMSWSGHKFNPLQE